MNTIKFLPDLVIADFDGTITQKIINWKTIPSLISILRDNEWFLDEDYEKKAKWLYEKYGSIEKNPNLSYKEKYKAMEEWWTKHYELLIEKWLTKSIIQKAVNHKDVKIREWFKEFVEILKNKKIPIIILSSSWLGDESIKMTLEKFNISMDNIIVISNKLKFDNNWKFIWVNKEDLIHWMNKKLKDHLNKEEIRKLVEGKEKILLLWDNLHDPKMLDGIGFDKVINIGFFLPKDKTTEQEELNKYKQVYDIILPGDSDFKSINELIS
jgi:HAD superfamily hydrolase (TIGR01544 family)